MRSARPRFQPEALLIQGHKDESGQEAVPAAGGQGRHAKSRDRAGRDRDIEDQHEDSDSDSQSARYVTIFSSSDHQLMLHNLDRHYRVEQRPQPGHRPSRNAQTTRRQEANPTARARVTESFSSVQPAFRSGLGQLARLFASIEEFDYADCRDFIVNRPEILDEHERDFLRDAVLVLASSQPERDSRAYARRCIQQSLILRHCKQRDRKGREKFFALLEEEEKKTSVEFLRESDTALDHCLGKARELREATSDRQTAPVVAAVSTQRPSLDIRHNSRDDELSRRTSNLNIEPPGQYRHGPTSGTAVSIARPANASDIQPERHRRASTATAGSNTNAVVRINQDGLLRPRHGTLIRGTNGEEEELDASYYKRDSAAAFFVKGRVFAVLWHEATGETSGDRVSEISFRGRFNEPITSHIRRMVVIRPGQGNCWAIPINTYRGHGVAKHGFKQVDVDGHAVIHAANTQPYTSPQEPPMTKVPLKVNMVQGERLDRMSRINFTTVHTVQHNVKVKNLGMVSRDSKDDLQDYWSAQMAS
jgi:hypothetical protein